MIWMGSFVEGDATQDHPLTTETYEMIRQKIGEPIGNIRDFDYDFARLWSGKSAQLMRKNIRRIHCFCTYECATTSNILFNPKYIPTLIRELLR